LAVLELLQVQWQMIPSLKKDGDIEQDQKTPHSPVQ
jgi:hypothetical protein